MKSNDQGHREETSTRWGYRISAEDWSPDKCGRCTFWVPLGGRWGLDWGACSNAQSPQDGKVTHEQDRCAAFVDGGDRWARTSGSAHA